MQQPEADFASILPGGLAWSSMVTGPDTTAIAPPATKPELGLWGWLREGLRAGVFKRPRVAGYAPHAWQMLALVLLFYTIEIAFLRLQMVGPAVFSTQNWLASLWILPLFIGLAWWSLPAQSAGVRPLVAGVAACCALALGASLPPALVFHGVNTAFAQGWLSLRGIKGDWPTYAYWLFVGMVVLWSLVVSGLLLKRLGGPAVRVAASVLILAAANGISMWQLTERAWEEDFAQTSAEARDRPRLVLSQAVFERQQVLLASHASALLPERPGVADVYGLVFAPYASEDVFNRESAMVAGVLESRFDAAGRVIRLVNHATTTDTHAWATPANLERAVAALAERMNVAEDIVVVYLTSHGAKDFKLAAEHWPLEVEPVAPLLLKNALDKAGIRHRVIAVSACYSGGWIEPLADETTLVTTAADATHTSYGCGRLSELTFFGRALFDEGLRRTHSFEAAFAGAVPMIRQREIDAGKNDGFSNPQISVGAAIAPVLVALEARLGALPAAPGSAPLLPLLPTPDPKVSASAARP